MVFVVSFEHFMTFRRTVRGRWGVPAERLGGGGARSRSRIAGSGGRAVTGLPAATGRVADGAGPMKTTGHVKTESTEAVVHLWA